MLKGMRKRLLNYRLSLCMCSGGGKSSERHLDGEYRSSSADRESGRRSDHLLT